MIIAVDFDGTIVEHRYPSIGKELPYAIETLKALQNKGHLVILWTYRTGLELDQALEFCRKKGLEFYAVNRNYPEEEYDQTYSRKIYADLFIDDRNLLGLPSWKEIYQRICVEKNGEGLSPDRKRSVIKRLFSSY